MTLIDDLIPAIDDDGRAPAGPRSAAGLAVREIFDRASSRRTVMRFGFAGVSAMAVTAVGGLGAAVARAATGPQGETEYTNCTVYASNPSYTGTCFGGSISSSYCNSSKWHRTDGYSYTCVSGRYYIAWDRCNDREAWRWVTSGRTYRCADGINRYQTCGGGGMQSQYTICQAQL